MELLGRDVQPCQAVLQVQQEHGDWLDFCSIKDEGDCRQAERMIDTSGYRIVMRDWWDGVMQWIKYEGGDWWTINDDMQWHPDRHYQAQYAHACGYYD